MIHCVSWSYNNILIVYIVNIIFYLGRPVRQQNGVSIVTKSGDSHQQGDMADTFDYQFFCLYKDYYVFSVTWGPGGLAIRSEEWVGLLGSVPLSNLVIMRPQAPLPPQLIRQ